MIKLALGISVSTVFAWALGRYANPREVWTLLRRVDPVTVCFAIAFLFAAFVLRAARWWLTLRKTGVVVTFSEAFQVLLAGFAMNNLLPCRAGDIMRVVGFQERFGCSRSTLLGSLILERALDLLAIILIGSAVLSFPGVTSPCPGTERILLFLMMAGSLSLAALLLFADRFHKFGSRIVTLLRHRPQVAKRVDQLIGNVLAVFKSIGIPLGAKLALLSIAIWGLEGLVYVCCARGVLGINSHFAPWLAMVFANFSMALPSAPGAVGTFHAGAMSGMVAYGASVASSAAFAILVHFVLWLPISVSGLLCFIMLQRDRKSVRSEPVAPEPREQLIEELEAGQPAFAID